MALVKSNNNMMKYVPLATGLAVKGAKALVPYAPTIIDAAGNVVSAIRNRTKKKVS